MKKIIVALSAITVMLFVADFSFGQLGGNLKHKACVKACDTAYNKCKDRAEKKEYKKCMKDAEKIQDEGKRKKEEVACMVQKEATVLACKKTQNDCKKKCN